MNFSVETLRVFPKTWLEPVDFCGYFEHPEHPFHIDLGCGRGRFLLARATQFPKVNFMGIDRQLNRIEKIDKKAIRQRLFNIRLLRIDGNYLTIYLLPPNSVDTYYVFYPDPWPKEKHHRRRMFNQPFVDAISRTLKSGGLIHSASDYLPYFDEIDALFKNDPRFKETEIFVPSEDEVSDFELIFAHKPPKRCSFVRL